MLRFAGKTENISSFDDKKYGDIISFIRHYPVGEYLFIVMSWSYSHWGGNKLRRLLFPQDVQDYVYIQPCGVFSNMQKVGDFFARQFGKRHYDDKPSFIIQRCGLEISTVKHYHYRVEAMKVDAADYNYEGFKFDALPPPGLPIVYHNQIIGRMPEDAPVVVAASYDDSER